MKKAHINLTIDNALLQWIDMDRGQTPRSSFINDILEKVFAKNKEIFDWSEEGRKADDDIKMGRVKKFKNSKEALKWLKN